jgi:hypothetical protein
LIVPGCTWPSPDYSLDKSVVTIRSAPAIHQRVRLLANGVRHQIHRGGLGCRQPVAGTSESDE